MNTTVYRVATLAELNPPRNVALLSRESGKSGRTIHPETLRYILKKKMKRDLELVPNYQALGLTPTYIVSKCPTDAALSKDLPYLRRYEHTTDGSHWFYFAAPANSLDSAKRKLHKKHDRFPLLTFETEQVLFRRDFGLFETSLGDFVKKMPYKIPSAKHFEAVPERKMDRIDLQLLSELEKNPLIHLVHASHNVGLHTKTAEYHYRVHLPAYILGYRTNLPASERSRSFIVKLDRYSGAFVDKLAGHPLVRSVDLLKTGAIMHVSIDDDSVRGFTDFLEEKVREGNLENYSLHEVKRTVNRYPSYADLYSEERGWISPLR